MKVIEYKGQTLKTIHTYEVSKEKQIELKQQYYQKPDFALIEKELKGLANGKSKISNIERYYVRDLMAKTKLSHSKWSIEEMFECKELVEYFYAKVKTKVSMCPPENSDIKNFETMLRLGGKGIAVKPSNFPIKAIDSILQEYNINDNYYDFSCGWGVRLLSSLRNNVNYFGTDPNYLLVERLEEMHKDYKRLNHKCPHVDIRAVGSEHLQEDWVNKIGVAFSSPPYFDLEDYRVGEQSYKEGMAYEDWLNGYFGMTLDNIKEYLVDNGYLIINVNNINKHNLVEDIYGLATTRGYTYVTTHTLKNIKRINPFGELNDNSEGIMVFQKRK